MEGEILWGRNTVRFVGNQVNTLLHTLSRPNGFNKIQISETHSSGDD
jgi:hypothetical protein